jgi:hypothetical protein
MTIHIYTSTHVITGHVPQLLRPLAKLFRHVPPSEAFSASVHIKKAEQFLLFFKRSERADHTPINTLPPELLEKIICHAVMPGGVPKDPAEAKAVAMKLTTLETTNRKFASTSRYILGESGRKYRPLRQAYFKDGPPSAIGKKIVALANRTDLNAEELTREIKQQLSAFPHIKVDLSSIRDPERRPLVMKALSTCTHLRTAEIRLLGGGQGFFHSVGAAKNLAANNQGLSTFKLHVTSLNEDSRVIAVSTIPGLTALDVSDSKIGAEGAKALAGMPSSISLNICSKTKMNVYGSQAGIAAKAELDRRTKQATEG